MSPKDPDRELTRLFEEQRRADEASAPDFRELLARPRPLRASLARGIPRPALAAAAAAVVAAALFLRRPPRPPAPEPGLPAAAAALASWKAPTDVLLETPGAELLGRLPVLLSPAPETTPAVMQR